MVPLPRLILKAIVPGPYTKPSPDRPLQESLGKCPWRVAIASMLLCRTTRRQAEPALFNILRKWPAPEYLCRADSRDVEFVSRLRRNRARQLIRFSSLWLGDGWEDLRELPGVGVYVADAVGLACLG